MAEIVQKENKVLRLIAKEIPVKEEKTAQHAVHQAKCVVWNIRAMENGGKFKRYVGEESPLVISLGKWNGLFVYKKFVLTGIIPGLLKTAIEIREMMKYR